MFDLGLLTATIVSEVYKSAQPALLFLVPSTLLPLLVIGYLNVSAAYILSSSTPHFLHNPKMRECRLREQVYLIYYFIRPSAGVYDDFPHYSG
jgi:hypothetical protein